MKKTREKYQQGDVLFYKLDDDDFQERKKKASDNKWNYLLDDHNSLVVAEGEATGHKHLISSTHPIITYKKANPPSVNSRSRYELVTLTSDAVVSHEEHNNIKLPSGSYQIKIVKEYDHIAGRTRGVID